MIDRTPVLAGLLAVFGFVGSSAPASALTDLGTLGGDEAIAKAMNGSGDVVGQSTTAMGQVRAFLYSAGTMLDLGTLGGDHSFARDVSDAGHVVGGAQTASGEYHAFLYTGGPLLDLGTLGGTLSVAVAVNDAGQVAGYSTIAGDGETHAFLYSGGVMTDLGTLGGDESTAVDINASGQVIGNSRLAGNSDTHGFLYTGGMMIDLGTLGGPHSEARAINDAGQVVGDAYLPESVSNYRNAFLWQAGVMTDLGSFGEKWSEAHDINEAGQITGLALSPGTFPGNAHAFLYENGAATNLGFLGETASNALQINAAGQIAGYGFVTMPVPSHHFLFSQGNMRDLGTLGVFPDEGIFLNDAGQVAGNYRVSPTERRAYRRDPACGDGIHDLGEECDDFNLLDGDCCASDCTYPGPATTCIEHESASLYISDSPRDGRDRLSLGLKRGEAVSHASLGDPSSSTTYTLCISDSSAGTDRLVSTLILDAGNDWEDLSPKGWSYDGVDGAPGGVASARLKPGAAGRSSVKIRATGANVPLPAPFDSSSYFEQDSRVTVQLFGDPGSCWSAEFATARSNTTTRFKAKAP